MKALCIINDLIVREVDANNVLVKSTVDSEGCAKQIISEEVVSGEPYRRYECLKCKNYFDGSESFDECRAHLGRMNEVLHPFTD